MMSARMHELALRKRMLRQRSAVLRRTLAGQVNAQVAPVVSLADKALVAGRWLRQHPYLLVGAGVALAFWRPAGLTRLAGRGLWLWQAWQRYQPVLKPLLARFGPGAGATQGQPGPQADQPQA